MPDVPFLTSPLADAVRSQFQAAGSEYTHAQLNNALLSARATELTPAKWAQLEQASAQGSLETPTAVLKAVETAAWWAWQGQPKPNKVFLTSKASTSATAPTFSPAAYIDASPNTRRATIHGVFGPLFCDARDHRQGAGVAGSGTPRGGGSAEAGSKTPAKAPAISVSRLPGGRAAGSGGLGGGGTAKVGTMSPAISASALPSSKATGSKLKSGWFAKVGGDSTAKAATAGVSGRPGQQGRRGEGRDGVG